MSFFTMQTGSLHHNSFAGWKPALRQKKKRAGLADRDPPEGGTTNEGDSILKGRAKAISILEKFKRTS